MVPPHHLIVKDRDRFVKGRGRRDKSSVRQNWARFDRRPGQDRLIVVIAFLWGRHWFLTVPLVELIAENRNLGKVREQWFARSSPGAYTTD
jgi:hypothetical protein